MKTQSHPNFALLERIAKIISAHVGKCDAVKSSRVAKELGKKAGYSRQVRRLVSENIEWFWEQGVPILAVSGTGFFVGSDIEEFQQYDQYLTALNFNARRKQANFRKLCKKRGLHLEAAA